MTHRDSRQQPAGEVALRKESVDRNLILPLSGSLCCLSLSARRAWIEIQGEFDQRHWLDVALRKESVDRNNDTSTKKKINPASLSARRAWIEILIIKTSFLFRPVALRKESVDRNDAHGAQCSD